MGKEFGDAVRKDERGAWRKNGGKNSDKSSGRMHTILRAKTPPCFPYWMGRGKWNWGPSFLLLWKPPLGLGSGFSAFPSGDTSSGLRELSPLVRPLSQQLSPTPAYHEPPLPAWTALATAAKTEKTGSACKQGRRSPLPSWGHHLQRLSFRQEFRLSHQHVWGLSQLFHVPSDEPQFLGCWEVPALGRHPLNS